MRRLGRYYTPLRSASGTQRRAWYGCCDSLWLIAIPPNWKWLLRARPHLPRDLPPPPPLSDLQPPHHMGLHLLTVTAAGAVSAFDVPVDVAQAADEPSSTPTGPTTTEQWEWLAARELTSDLTRDSPADAISRRHTVFSNLDVGEDVPPPALYAFRQALLPWEHRLAATQYCIGLVDAPEYQYRLEVSNETPIHSKPMRMTPREEAWLDTYLDELLAKEVITPILPTEQPQLVTPVLLVP